MLAPTMLWQHGRKTLDGKCNAFAAYMKKRRLASRRFSLFLQQLDHCHFRCVAAAGFYLLRR